MNKIRERDTVQRGLGKYTKQFGTAQYDMGMKGGQRYVRILAHFLMQKLASTTKQKQHPMLHPEPQQLTLAQSKNLFLLTRKNLQTN